MPEKTYGIGMLGCGFIGKVHAYSHHVMPYYYEDLPWNMRFVGVCTSRDESARSAKEEIGFEFGTTEPEEVIRHPDVDVVHICTPNSLHLDELLSAIDAGKNLYCDKPVTSNWEEAKKVLKALENYNATHQMTFHNRFFPATLRAKMLMAENFVGEVTCFRCEYLHSGSVDPDKPLGWKLDASMGGGVINDLATHVIDLIRHLIGDFTEVACSTRILHDTRPSRKDPDKRVPVEAEDHVILTLHQENGAIGTIEASKIATGMQDELRFEIHGIKGALRFNLMDPNWLEIYNRDDPGEPIGGKRGWKKVECVQRYPEPGGKWPATKASIGWLRGHIASLFNFMNSLHRAEKAEPGLEVGAEIQRIAAAARRADESGRVVQIGDIQ
ncbi:MAG: Gfo/Idh/MocA family protein [Candidatus Brocadiia bacterium]